MDWSAYWGALSPRQRSGMIAAAASIAVVTIALTVWLLRDPYVSLAKGLSTERLNQLAQDLDRAKLSYRISEGGDSVTVPRSQLGKAHAAAAAGPFDVPPSVGLELFKESDFSSTDFAQRINYQRALQGELTRTIQTIDGIRSARVHVVLPDGGLFKRNAAKSTAAVSVALQTGALLTRAQVRGIQRLVAASVPEIKIDDVVVLDESGASLTRPAEQSEDGLSSAQLDLKRQADQYFESKLVRLLQDLVPQGIATLSVDTTLDDKQLRVTTEEPIPVRGSKDVSHATGVLVKERQSRRGGAPGLLQTDGYAPESDDSTDSEYEYQVGNRVEQMLSAPGSIKRVSVAVALQGAPAELSRAAIEELVAHAVGVDRSRGDSVAVLLLPVAHRAAAEPPDEQPATEIEMVHPSPAQPQTQGVNGAQQPQARRNRLWQLSAPAAVLVAALAALIAVLSSWWIARRARSTQASDVDEDAVAAKVRQWLNEGAGNVRA